MAENTPFYWRPPTDSPRPETMTADLCVYGGTACGVVAAIQAACLGLSVVLVAPEQHLGGMTTGGLSWTDFGNKDAIQGMARAFYRALGAKYRRAEEWKFEPHVAEEVLEEWVNEARVPIRRGHFLAAVQTERGRILALTTESRLTVRAKLFLDATYEGDLMAKAGVRYAVGREGNAAYTETLNGVQLRDKHQFLRPVSPYVTEDDSNSGLLPGVNPTLAPPGTGDSHVQAYCFRLCLTRDPANRLPYPKPDGYNPADFVLLERYLKAGFPDIFNKFDPLVNGKFDKNNHGGVSTDYIGASDAYPDADYARRERIFQDHVRYQQGLMWFLANEPVVPDAIRNRWAEWGLCRDEFTDTGGWSRQLYVREARRMIADIVMTEHHCRGKQVAEDSIGLASYTMDSHNCQRVVVDGAVKNEGDVQVGGLTPYPISYRAIVPRRRECVNLFVPVCLSTSHIAYGSIRMEPVFMILGQSAAIAAKIAVANNFPAVQDVPYNELEKALTLAGQRLRW